LWPSNSPDLSEIDYKICGITQQRLQSTEMQDVNDFMQRLIYAWVEWKTALFKMSLTIGSCVCIQPPEEIMYIRCDKN